MPSYDVGIGKYIMKIYELLQLDGLFPKKVGSTGGGEFAGPCPWCGGDDRFRIWPNQGETGKYWCRGCGRHGDAIEYLREFRRMTFPEACAYLGREVPPLSSLVGSRTANKPHWEPRLTAAPGDLWQAKARALVAESVSDLWGPYSKLALDFLIKNRGLTERTIKGFSLGYILNDQWEPAPEWGLEEVLNDNGKAKKLWFPRGIVIPLCHGDQVLRVRIRRPKAAGDPRYFLHRGSDTRAMILGSDKTVSILVESELDALLLHQEAGDLVNVISLGNAQTRPDQQTAELLNRSELILVSLDDDEAGATESWQWWKKHYSHMRRWPPLAGKDPGDMLAAGMNLRTWVEGGLIEYAGATIHREAEPEPGPGTQPLDLPSGACLFHHCDLASYRSAALFCREAAQEVINLAGCPLGLWFRQPDGWPVEGS